VISIIAIITAIAIPSLMHGRKSANEASSIGSLKAIATANEQYRVRFLTYAVEATGLADLNSAGYIDSVLGSSTKSSYAFTYGSTGSAWTCTATPAPPSSGDRYFWSDTSGVIRFAEDDPVTSASTPID
jgi:type IV pilus assembly protein PilA